MLGRLGLELLGGGDKGHVGQVHAEAVAAQLPTQLTHGLEVRQRLDIAHGAAYFGDYEIVVARVAEIFYITLDFVGDMRHYLYGLAEIVATALLVNHRLVYSAGGNIVCARCANVGKTLVVPQVEVGLVAVLGHVALAVLVGVERARVDVDIRVKFLDCHTEATSLEQTGQR